MLERGLEMLDLLKVDLHNQGAADLHDNLRAWEVWDRVWCLEAHMRHMMFREETRWPGYYYRADFPKLDEENWKCFGNSTYDVDTGKFTMEKKPYILVVP
jgi:adenylylsulfate reductase subunit A